MDILSRVNSARFVAGDDDVECLCGVVPSRSSAFSITGRSGASIATAWAMQSSNRRRAPWWLLAELRRNRPLQSAHSWHGAIAALRILVNGPTCWHSSLLVASCLEPPERMLLGLLPSHDAVGRLHGALVHRIVVSDRNPRGGGTHAWSFPASRAAHHVSVHPDR